MSNQELVKLVSAELTEARQTLDRFLGNAGCLEAVVQASEVMIDALRSGRKIFSCGNGGSHCDAMHFAEELSGVYRKRRRALAALAISDPSHISCVGNDLGYDQIFARYIEALAHGGDVLVVLTTSGNSPNLVAAVTAAKERGVRTVALLGRGGGKLKGECDVEILVDHEGFSDRVQEIHIKVIHILILLIERGLGVSS